MSALFDPIRLSGVDFPNRIMVAPMCQYSAIDGVMQDWHLANLGQIAMGGPGLVFIEATGVEAAGRITPGCVGLWNDAQEEAMGRVVAFCRSVGQSKMGLQIGHAGRKGSSHKPWDGGHALAPNEGAWETFAPSALPADEGWHVPTALDQAGLARIREGFVQAAERAARIGLDVLEVHCAHGYLLHEFLSPVANRRADAYGGSLEGRLRFPLEVVRAVRAVWPEDRPLFVRVSATDWLEDGESWDLDQTVAFAEALGREGVTAIDVSSGGMSPKQKIPLGPGYQVFHAAEIRRRTGLPTVAVGMITEPAQADMIVRSGQADMVALAREFLRDPRWTWRAARALGAKSASTPPQYLRAANLPR